MARRKPRSEEDKLREEAWRMISQGLDAAEIAAKTGLATGTIYRLARQFKANPVQDPKSRPAPGRSPKLTEEETRMLRRMLLLGRYQGGQTAGPWTSDRISRLIWFTYDKKFGAAAIHEIMTGLGWHPEGDFGWGRPFPRGGDEPLDAFHFDFTS